MDNQLAAIIKKSRRIVFFGGAGVSCESGIPDFRSADGLYRQQWADPPEEILSAHYFPARPGGFLTAFTAPKCCTRTQSPNAAHRALARLEREGKLTAVATQNIDGLHQAAGSKTVFELHGSVHRNHCTRCGKFWPLEAILQSEGVPRCTCGGVIKPDVVLYEEPLDMRVYSGAARAIGEADTLIVGGTSLNVYPAAGLLRCFLGDELVVINKTPTPADRSATLVLTGPIGELMAMDE